MAQKMGVLCRRTRSAWSCGRCSRSVRRNNDICFTMPVETFYFTPKIFAKTGSGRAWEHTKARSQKPHRCRVSRTLTGGRLHNGVPVSGKETRVLLRHLYIKVIILPRQARDKHRESTQKRMRFCRSVRSAERLRRWNPAARRPLARSRHCGAKLALFWATSCSFRKHNHLPRQARKETKG